MRKGSDGAKFAGMKGKKRMADMPKGKAHKPKKKAGSERKPPSEKGMKFRSRLEHIEL